MDIKSVSIFAAQLPVPPSSNNAYFNVPKGGRVLTKKARAWKKEAVALLLVERQKMLLGGKAVFPFKHCLRFLSMHVDWSCDITNRIKLVDDALVDAGVILDDKYIEMEATERAPSYSDIEELVHKPLAENMLHVQVCPRPFANYHGFIQAIPSSIN